MAEKTSQTTAAVTISSLNNVTVGNLIVVFVAHYAASVTMTVTDNLANTYSQAGSYKYDTSGDTNYGCSMFYTVVSTGGACTITITPSISAYITAGAMEFSGVAASPLDGTSSNSGSSSTTLDAGNVTVSASDELVCAAFVLATGSSDKIAPIGPMQGAVIASGVSGGVPMIGIAGIASATMHPKVAQSATISYSGVSASFASSGGGGGGLPANVGIRTGGRL